MIHARQLKQKYYYYKRLMRLAQREMKNGVGTMYDRLRLYQKGFLSENRYLYNLGENNIDDYVSDKRRAGTLARINDEFKCVLDDKALFYLFFRDKIPIVPVIAATIDKRLVVIEKGDVHVKSMTGDYIAKPALGGGGDGVIRISVSRGTIENHYEYGFKHNIDLEDFLGAYYGNTKVIVQRAIVQSDYSSEVFPGTINTIRVLTFRDNSSSEVVCLSAVHRFGTDTSGYTDNFSKGGLSVSIDIETGTLGRGAVQRPEMRRLDWYDRHPNSGMPLAGVRLSCWEEIRNVLSHLYREVPILGYVGWDIVPVTRNKIMFLEGNSNSDINLLQVHGPLLRNKVFAQWIKYHERRH